MSSIFQEGDVGLGAETIASGKQQAAEAAAKLKDKKEETAKTVEEGLASLKVMVGGKGVTKAFMEDPLVKKYSEQLKKKAADAVKDTAKQAYTKIQDRLSQATRGTAAENPSAVEEGVTYNNPLFDEGIAEVGTAADAEGLARAALLGRLAAARGRVRIAAREARVTAQKAQEAQIQDVNFGRAAEERVAYEAPPAYEEQSGLSQTTSRPLNSAPEVDAPEVDVAAPGASTATPIFDADEAATRAAASAARTAAVEGGEEAAVGGGEAVLSGLDAIPGLDVLTLLIGAGLGIGAAAKKRPQAQPVMPAAPQAHVAYQAGFAQV